MADFKDISIEKVKKFWDSRPCNIRHSSAPLVTRRYFDEVEKRKYFVEPHIIRFAQFEKWRGKRVLEIGCGIGTDTINFARQGAFITAVDISPKSIEIAKQRAEIYGLENKIKFYPADAEELSKFIPIEPYDLIYSFGVIHHSPHPERIIEEIKKFTHQGTVLKIMVYNRYSWKVLWILIKYGRFKFWKARELIANYSEAQFDSPVTYTYSFAEVKKILKDFRIINIFIDHIFPYEIEEYINYNYKKIWYFYLMPSFIFKWLERYFGWHICVTAKSRLYEKLS